MMNSWSHLLSAYSECGIVPSTLYILFYFIFLATLRLIQLPFSLQMMYILTDKAVIKAYTEYCTGKRG